MPIFYESRMPELHIIGQTIDQVFDHVFADRSEEERAAIKQRFATEQNIAGAPRRIEAICLNLIDHFTQFIAPNGFKAQVVAVNRDMAVTYKETLDRLNGPESAIIMSSAHNDEERLARWHLRKDDQDRLIERFKDKDDPLAILVVCDMLLTGFDVPVEQVMYLDSPLKEHTLLQAIARVNRPYGDDKTYGLVVDYWGVSEELQDALAIFSTTDIQGALQPKVDELPRLQTRHAAAMRFFQKVTDKTNLDACVRVLEPEDVRAEFDVSFRRFSQSHGRRRYRSWAHRTQSHTARGSRRSVGNAWSSGSYRQRCCHGDPDACLSACVNEPKPSAGSDSASHAMMVRGSPNRSVWPSTSRSTRTWSAESSPRTIDRVRAGRVPPG